MNHLRIRTFVLMVMGALMLGIPVRAQVQWMRQGGTGGAGRGIGHDDLGNCFVTGVVNDPTRFDQDSAASHFADAFIAKYDAVGSLQWVRTGGGPLIDQSNDIALDSDGNAYITGSFSTNGLNPSVDFSGTVITGTGSLDLFLAKYAPDGELLWLRAGGGSMGDEGRGVALTPDGDVVVSGYFQGSAVFGSQTLISDGLSDVVLLRYHSDGSLVWAMRAGGTGDDQATKLTALQNGDIATVGSFQGSASFGDTTLLSTGLANIFVARFNGQGEGLWAAQAGSGLDFAGDLATDIDQAPNGDLVFCGHMAGDAAFGDITVQTNGSLDVFLARYSGSGTPSWVHHGGGPQQDHAYGVAVDADGNAFLTGQADDGASTVFDDITLAPFGNEAVFLAKYDASGNVQWVRRYAPGQGGAVDVLDNDCLYFTGGASGIVGQPAFDDIPWQYVDRAIFTARFCADPSTGTAVEAMGTGFNAFPLPASDLLNVQLPGAQGNSGQLLLVNSMGSVVKTVKTTSDRFTIYLGVLADGCYQLLWITASGVSSRTVVIAR